VNHEPRPAAARQITVLTKRRMDFCSTGTLPVRGLLLVVPLRLR
jgi:hypothetical protein